MNRRRALALAAVGLLVALAGCSAVFGGISDEELDREGDYDDLRDRDADVVVEVEDGGFIAGNEFRAVYDLNGTEELSLYRSSFFTDHALDVHSVRYWYPNGTAVNGSELAVDQGQSSTSVGVPDENGTLAFSGDADRRSFELPAYVDGSYEVTLPPGYRTSNLLFGDVSPGGYERDLVDDRERLTWEDNGGTIYLRYYLSRDVPLFAGLIGVVLLAGGLGIGYYYREIKRLRRQREEMGLDVDVDDDDDRRPPPGMR